MTDNTSAYTARIALVGDRSPQVRAHSRVPMLLDGLGSRDRLDLDLYWVPTAEVSASSLAKFDGIWLLPGSPYESEAGAIDAVRIARENDIPFLGTCAGFQHAMLEFARNVCGRQNVQHAETAPDAEDQLIVPLSCSLAGHEGAVTVTAGSLAARLLGVERSVERYHCSYGLDAGHLDLLREHGMTFTGYDDDGDPRIAELPGHPFFLATLFQPELTGDSTRPHPIVRGFATAVARRATAVPEAV